MMSGLAACQLALHAGGRVLVDALDLLLEPGEVLGVLGANGAGKSTLLTVLAGLALPARGQAMLDGQPVAALPPLARARHIGLLPQADDGGFLGSVADFVALGRYPFDVAQGGPFDAAQGRPFGGAPDLAAHLAAWELADLARRPLATLSGGERQRARLAQLLVQSPQWWLLDEPLAHLDLGHQLAVMELFARLARAGRTVIMALHEPLWAARYCGHALLVYDSGRFRHGPAHDVLTQDHLEALYGCRLAPAAASATPLFVPIR
jgi:iron complex transport system ATP-binding protein